jgi:transposase-like protein
MRRSSLTRSPVKVRDGQVANRAFYAAIGVGLDGTRDVLGIWGSPGGEGAKYWLSVLTEITNRGVTDTFFLVCDGLEGLPDAVEVVWPQTTVQTCILHLIRNTFRYALCCVKCFSSVGGGVVLLDIFVVLCVVLA